MPNENQHIEFKPNFNADVIETLVAFANTKGGKVLIGVDDAGNPIENFTIGKESIPVWVNEIKTKTQPSIIPDAEMIKYKGNAIVEFSIQEYPIKPVACRGKYFKRVANSNHQLSLNEILNLHIKTFNSSWDYYPDPNHSVLDISEDKALKLISLYNKNRPLPIEKDVFEFLTKLELLRDGNLTNAGFLLLMKNDSIISDIELGYFQDEITIKDGITISADLVTEVEEIMAFVRKHISKEFIITANPARIERWDYPLDAIREIVLNMIVHRDYTHRGNSSVKIFPDHIEFFNPGRLPDQISINDLLRGSYVSDCRNKQIARIFKEIEWIERYGTGIRRIKDFFKDYDSPEPVFENFQHGFRVTVYALQNNVHPKDTLKDTLKDTPKDTLKDTPKITKGENKVLVLIQNNNNITREEIAQQLNISINTVKKFIGKLKQKGALERMEGNKGGYWKVIKTS
jgi:ATP-dependent DNA helicase RecG